MAENHRWKVMMNEEMENDAAIRDLVSGDNKRDYQTKLIATPSAQHATSLQASAGEHFPH